jgi:LmbE family N-acetylglucosaminyl deacetylase
MPRHTLKILLASFLLCHSARAQGLGDYSTMQIIAHQDDDLFFMNPDIRNMIAAGYGSVTVYLTAGEANGSYDRTQSRELFAASRQEGEREAYTAMVGLPNEPGTWDRSVLAVRDGNLVEIDTLIAMPQIKLVFMNLPDGGDELPENIYGLYRLYAGVVSSLTTIVPTGTPITQAYVYSRESLLGSLSDLIEMFHPFVVRTLDPHPRQKGSFDGPCGEVPPLDFVSFDNSDHTHTARFVNLVLAAYLGPGGKGHTSVLHYVGLSVGQHQGNLGEVEYAWKRGTVDAYKKWDSSLRQLENCYLGLFGATYERYPGNTTWMVRQPSGRLVAVAVENRNVVFWAERSAGGAWIGPTSIGGGPVAPHVAIGRRLDGRLQIFALRLPLEQEQAFQDGAPIQEIITSTQTSPGALSFGPWEGLGNPDRGACADPHYCRWTGLPAVAPNADGRLQVFLRNGGGGVSTKWELVGGGWSDWLDMGGGPDIIDGLAAITSIGGRIEVFGTTRLGRIAHWYQIAPNEIFAFDETFPQPGAEVTSATSPPTATFNADGRLEVFYRVRGTARVHTAYQEAVDGSWSTNLVDLEGDAGLGPIAAFLHESGGLITIFERNAYGGVSGTAQIGPNNVFDLEWDDFGGLIPGLPTAAIDFEGKTVLATVGINGNLYIRRQVSANPQDPFEPWTEVGSLFPTDGGLQSPGDANGDGDLDLSDAVWILGHLFLGLNPDLPCEGGGASDPGPGELLLLDMNGDGKIDIADPVHLLGYLFGGDRPPPAPGVECLRITGCGDACRS